MSTLQQLQTERANFIAAYTQHRITKQQLDTALATNQRQINAIQTQQSTQQAQTSTAPAASAPVGPMPAETPQQQFTDQSGTTWKNTQATEPPKTPEILFTGMGPMPYSTFEAGTKDPTMQNIVIPALEVAGIAALSAIPGAAPVVIGGAVAGVGLDIGIKSAVKSYETGEAQLVLPTTVREVTDTALLSAGLSAVGGGAVGAVAKVAPSIASQAANPIVRAATRTAINAGLGGGVSGVASGGNPQAILEGAALGAGLGVAGELAGPIASKTNALIGKTGTGKAAIDSINTIKENTIGSKFTEIIGAKEVVSQQTTGKTTDITRVTQPETKTVTLRGEEVRFYKENNLQTMKNPVIELSGTQRTKVLQQDAAGVFEEITTYPKAPTQTASKTAKFDMVGDINKEFGVIESVKGFKQNDMPLRDPTVITSTRSAKPILEALKGDTATFEKITPISEAKITVTKGRISPNKPTFDIGVDKPITVLEKTAIVSDSQFLPNMKSAFREYNSIRIYDKPIETSDLFSRATGRPKNIAETPELFERVTGKVAEKPVKTKDVPFVNNEQINILKDQAKTQKIFDNTITDKAAFNKREAGDLSGPMKAGSNEFFRTSTKEVNNKATNDSIVGKGAKAETETILKSKPTQKGEALPRAIVGEAKGATTGAKFIPVVMPTQSTETKQNNRSAVTDVVKSDISAAIKTPVVPIEFVRTPTRITPGERQIFDVLPTQKTKENILPIVEPVNPVKPDQVIVPVRPVDQTPVRIVPIQPVTPRQQPNQPIIPRQGQPTKSKPISETKITEITMPKMGTKTTPLLKMPTVPKRATKFNLTVPTAGGGGGGGLFTGKTAKWYTKKHKVKTPAQMLQTFGVNVGGGRTQGFKAPSMKLAKNPSFNPNGFSSNQFNKMFQQPKTKRRR